MARARNIKPAFFANDDLADIAPLGRLLFIGLWTLADREGRLEDRPRRIKAEVLPYDDCDVDGLLNDLQSHGFITRYSIEGVGYVQVLNFTKHQNPHIKETDSTIPAPDMPDASTNQGGLPATEAASSPNVQSPETPCESMACGEHHTRTIQEQCKAHPKSERAGLIPDSPSLIPESSITNPDGLVVDSKPADQSQRTARPDCPHKQIIELYHELLPASPEIRNWTPARSAHLRTRWNESPERQNLDWWRRFFGYIAQSDFLTGQVHARDRKPFCAPLDWVCKADNFAKIIEGRYHEEVAV